LLNLVLTAFEQFITGFHSRMFKIDHFEPERQIPFGHDDFPDRRGSAGEASGLTLSPADYCAR
jgi:hypothetical protein